MENTQQSPAEYSKDARRVHAVAVSLERNLEIKLQPGIRTEKREQLTRQNNFNISQFVQDLEQYIQWCDSNSELLETAIEQTGTSKSTTKAHS